MSTLAPEKGRRALKKRVTVKAVIFVTLIQLITALYLGSMMVFHGPFPTLKRYVVTTAMSTYTHQYIATAFLSDTEIKKILAEGGSPESNIEQDISDVSVKNVGDKNIDLYKISGSQYEGYMLVVNDPTRVKIGITSFLGEKGQTTSAIAKDHKAVAAVNGGGFFDASDSGRLWAGTGANPTGFVITGGEVVFKDPGITKSTKLSVLAFDTDGKMIVGKQSINSLKKLKVSEALTFGPALVVNGKPAFKGDGGQGMNPRTAVGQRKDGAVLLLVLDGRRLNMLGATLKDAQKIMLDYGAVNATNLDGGSSSTMYYKNAVINNPCNLLGERTVATAVYVNS
ncbi:MAG: phosphodiester glycosidase family protein [Bacillota bacterium]|nr:phosphodiester glycosidase family protein [Bacillota bacterium]